MKRIILILMVLVMILSFAGCGEDDSKNSNSPANTLGATTKVEITETEGVSDATATTEQSVAATAETTADSAPTETPEVATPSTAPSASATVTASTVTAKPSPTATATETPAPTQTPTPVAVGDIIKFGTYEQDNNASNGKEDIEWIVLDKEADRVLVISKYGLDSKHYHAEDTDTTWEKCALRTWMNNDFFNSAFSDKEKAMIPTVTVLPDETNQYGEDNGNATQDKIFALNIAEVEKYFSSDSARLCVPTDYAISINESVLFDNGYCCWWLRTTGRYPYYAANVIYTGEISTPGAWVLYSHLAARPAMWIELG